MRFVYISVKPSPKRAADWEKAQQVNDHMAKMCAKDPLITFVDIGPALLDNNGKARADLFLKDQLHMTTEGFAGWAPIVKPVLEQL